MANIEQISEKSEALQIAIDEGQIDSITIHRGQGQNTNTRIVDLEPVIDRVLDRELRLDDLEKAASLLPGGGKFTIASQLVSGGFGPKYGFTISGIKDQTLREQLIQQYGINPSNPVNSNRQNQTYGTQQNSSVYGPNANNGGQQNQQQQLQMLQQLLGLKQPQPQSNDLFGMLQSSLAPSQIAQSLQYYKQEIENTIKDLKREMDMERAAKIRELSDTRNELARRDLEHKKELQEIERKHEMSFKDLQSKFESIIKDINSEFRRELEKVETKYDYNVRDIRSDMDRRVLKLNMNRNNDLAVIKAEAGNGSKTDDFFKMWMTMNQQEKMDITRQLSESKLAADQIGSKQLELFIMSQNNNPSQKMLELLLAKSLEKNNDPNNLKYMETMMGWFERIKGDGGDDKSWWAKIGEALIPTLGSVAQGVTTGILNKKMPAMPAMPMPTMPAVSYPQPNYPPAPTAQPPITYPPQTSQTVPSNVAQFPKVNPIPPIPVQQEIINPITNNTFTDNLSQEDEDDSNELDMPNMALLETEWNNPETQNFVTSKMFPIFVQDNPEIIANQLFDSIGELDTKQICPEIMKLVHIIEDAIYERDFDAAFMTVNMVCNAMGLTMTQEQNQKAVNIFECYSRILKEQETQEGIK